MTEFLYLDRDLLVSVKPSGLRSEGEGADCFPTLLAAALREQGENDVLYPVHRLDRPTQGLMVFARTHAAAAALSTSLTGGSLRKEYLAVLHGSPEKASGTLSDWLFYDRKRGKSYVTDRPRKGVKEAILDYTVLSRQENLSLVHILLHTGRTHQIRVQFGSRGLPLCGDRTYGAPSSTYSLGLCAARLSFPHPITDQPLHFSVLPSAEADGSRVNPFALFEDALLTL